MKHTPEPWGIPDVGTDKGYVLVSAGGPQTNWNGMIASFDAGNMARSGTEGLENAKRAVSCVNACAGINPEAVPEMVKALEDLLEESAYFTKQRRSEYGESYGNGTDAEQQAREALAKLKASTP